MNHYKAIHDHLMEVHEHLLALSDNTRDGENADERDFVAQALKHFYPLFYGVQEAETAHDSFTPTARG